MGYFSTSMPFHQKIIRERRLFCQAWANISSIFRIRLILSETRQQPPLG